MISCTSHNSFPMEFWENETFYKLINYIILRELLPSTILHSCPNLPFRTGKKHHFVRSSPSVCEKKTNSEGCAASKKWVKFNSRSLIPDDVACKQVMLSILMTYLECRHSISCQFVWQFWPFCYYELLLC